MMLALMQICSEPPNPHACHPTWSTAAEPFICVLAESVIYLAKRRGNDRGNRCGRCAGSALPMLAMDDCLATSQFQSTYCIMPYISCPRQDDYRLHGAVASMREDKRRNST